jgi:hypothetical protein
MQYFSHAIQNGAMWARFGAVECTGAPRQRTAGLVAMGIDRLVLPDNDPPIFVSGKTLRRKSNTVKSCN